MLRSAGFFQRLLCPFSQEQGGCPRPYCHYQHGSPEPPDHPDSPTREPSCAAAEAPGKNMSELEKLTKAIEAVKNEVEESQKKLLLYANEAQSIKPTQEVDCNANILETVKDEPKSTKATEPPVLSRNSRLPHKYVVDRSCPATDLEYDPLLNYTAGFFGSTSKESGNKRKNSEAFDSSPKKPRAASPIRLEIKLQESDDEDMLVIDAPPLEVVSRRQRPNKVCEAKETHIALDEANESTDEKMNQYAEETSLDELNVTYVPLGCEIVNKSEASHDFPINCADSKDLEIKNVVGTDVEGNTATSSANAQILNEEASSLTSTEDEVKEEAELLREVKQELTVSPQESLNLPVDILNDCTEELQVIENATGVNYEDSVPALLIDEQQCLPDTSCLPKELKENENEVIVLDSSDSEDQSEDEILSDSDDPMEECLRIFNEFNEQEAKKHANMVLANCEEEHQPEAHDRGSDLLPGQKKRVARPTTKREVKESGNILVPYRGPTPQAMVPQRILRVQQQAVQISSAVRNGQTFVASSQKRITASSSQGFHNFGQMVCVNVLEVQPVFPARSQFGGFISERVQTAFKSAVSQRKTLPTTPVKIQCRRRSSVVHESSSKVPHEMRQRYVNSFVEEFLKESATVQEAFDKALAEEKSIYERCGSKNMYLNIAVNSLKKLRDQHCIPTGSNQSSSKERSKRQDIELTGRNLYNLLKEYLLSEDQLIENGYPRPNPDKPGSALIHNIKGKNMNNESLRRVCCRCGELYAVTKQGRHVRKEECNYHSGRVLRHKVPGGIETRYSCCEASVGAPGCQMAKLHVHDGHKDSFDGVVKTFPKLQPSDGNPGIFSLDCEMCYTTHGLELTRVSVVDHCLQVIYDTYVKPDNEIIDYNTRSSGITEDNLKSITTSIRDVQAILLNLFSADSILIGHSLENDLTSLKLIHDTVVDTSIVFPHRLGLPHKRALRNLIADYLQRIIQDSVGGHDSTEDATACMELMIWKVKEDTKGRR